MRFQKIINVHHTSDRICLKFMILFVNNICFKISLVEFMICFNAGYEFFLNTFMVCIHLGTNLVKSCYSTVGILQQTPFPKAACYTH